MSMIIGLLTLIAVALIWILVELIKIRTLIAKDAPHGQ